MSGELIELNGLFDEANSELAVQNATGLAKLDEMSQSVSFLQRIQLYSRGQAVDLDKIEKGHFGVPKQGDVIQDLGQSIDVLPLIRKAKAIDMSDKENIIVANDVESDEFKRIVDLADNTKDSGCAWGPTYLVYERSTKTFYEFFCGNKSSRFESGKINTYLPLTQKMIDDPEVLTGDETEPRFSKPLTLASTVLQKGRWTWHAPVASDCLTPFGELPKLEEFREQIEKFLKSDEPEVETVKETRGRKR